jgi:hypothetical protein
MLAQRCQLAIAFLWEYGYKRLKLAQLLGQLGVFLAWAVNALSADIHLNVPNNSYGRMYL